MSDRLDDITALSHEFGTLDYVHGGGGNTSWKNDSTVWVKPSGTTLAGLRREQFVALDRKLLRELYEEKPPADSAAREAMVQARMAAARLPGHTGRPSVEAPLHETFSAAFVVHTHPPLVNGMTCAKRGAAACAELFPDALWIPATDPGYTLCMRAREMLAAWTRERGAEPEMVFLESHGLFVAADTPDAIRSLYEEATETLLEVYASKGIETELAVGPDPEPARIEEIAAALRESLGADAAVVAASGPFAAAEGPVTPDHIVYGKAFPLLGEPRREAIEAYRKACGYAPRTIVARDGVFALGRGEAQAQVVLESAQDAALVRRLADAFGGLRYMDERAARFIENWEVENYRRQVGGQA